LTSETEYAILCANKNKRGGQKPRTWQEHAHVQGGKIGSNDIRGLQPVLRHETQCPGRVDRCRRQHRLGRRRRKVQGVFPVEARTPGGGREDGARRADHTAQSEAQRPKPRQGGRPQPLLPVFHRTGEIPEQVSVRARRPARVAQAFRNGFHKRDQRDRRQERQADPRTCGRRRCPRRTEISGR